MSWSYLTSDPDGADKDFVRLTIGDTSSGDQLLQDEEINALLAQYGGKWAAASGAADAVAAKFSREANKQIGQFRIDASNRSKQYAKLADRLRVRSAVATATPYAGGQTKADKRADQTNTSLVKPQFAIGFQDNPSLIASTST